jgi:hypothetical protein
MATIANVNVDAGWLHSAVCVLMLFPTINAVHTDHVSKLNRVTKPNFVFALADDLVGSNQIPT